MPMIDDGMDIDGEDNGPLMEAVDVPNDPQRGMSQLSNFSEVGAVPSAAWKSGASLLHKGHRHKGLVKLLHD